MDISQLPKKYRPIWDASDPFFAQGRPGDQAHAADLVRFLLSYSGALAFDPEVMIPTAMLHDIGHAAILPQHLKYVTGQHKLSNGKLVHMLTGAKIAHDILMKIDYPPEKSEEIVEIISMHDADQLLERFADSSQIYDTLHKRIFHDVDMLDRYTLRRMQSINSLNPGNNAFHQALENGLSHFFFDAFRRLAQNRLSKLSASLQQK